MTGIKRFIKAFPEPCNAPLLTTKAGCGSTTLLSVATFYLTSAPGLAGFEPVDDVRPILIDALKSIDPPDRDEGEGRFHPYGGSQNWKVKAEDTGEEDAGRWEIIAVANGPTDFVGVGAECVVSGVHTEFQAPFWRAQPYHGLEMRHRSKESFVAFAEGFPNQYTLTKAGMSVAWQVVT